MRVGLACHQDLIHVPIVITVVCNMILICLIHELIYVYDIMFNSIYGKYVELYIWLMLSIYDAVVWLRSTTWFWMPTRVGVMTFVYNYRFLYNLFLNVLLGVIISNIYDGPLKYLCMWLRYGLVRTLDFIYVNRDLFLDQMDSHNAYSIHLFMMMYF